MDKNINDTDTKDSERIYKYFGHEYVLAKELVKGGCQGCAFYTRMDCERTGRSRICNEAHKIFKLHLKLDER